jgi:hypothetical protein
MKKALLVLITLSFMSIAHAESKKVCHDFVENNKKVQRCKVIKTHKKVDGTKIPSKKVSK